MVSQVEGALTEKQPSPSRVMSWVALVGAFLFQLPALVLLLVDGPGDIAFYFLGASFTCIAMAIFFRVVSIATR